MIKNIGLISCVKKKKEGVHKARVLYSSPLFLKSRAYAEKYYDKWFILSAKYYLLNPDSNIKSYDETLSNKPAKVKQEWAAKTYKQIKKTIRPDNTIIYIHAGKNYIQYLLPLLKDGGYTFNIPLKGLRFGEQLSWYNKKL